MAKKKAVKIVNQEFAAITGEQLVKLVRSNKWEKKTITFSISIDNESMCNESGGDLTGSVTNSIEVFGDPKKAEIRLIYKEDEEIDDEE